MADLADAAAAVSAGYKKTQTDRGAASPNLRYVTDFTKPMVGVTGAPASVEQRAVGESSTSAAAADTQALAALNAQREHRHKKSGGGTIDVT